MIEKLKNMFTEETGVTCLLLGIGVVGGIVISVFTPIGKIFKRKKY